MTIDVQGLVDDKYLLLDDVFNDAAWARDGETQVTYTSQDGEAPCVVELIIERADAYGLTAYRWAEVEGGQRHDITGFSRLDRDDAVADGIAYAERVGYFVHVKTTPRC